MPGFGRIPAIDERDLKFALRRTVPEASKIRRRMWGIGSILDQGNTSHCVGFSWAGWLIGGPICTKPKESPKQLYDRAQQLDEWPGEEPEVEGSSVRAGAKALREFGYIKEFHWAWDAETVAQHVLAIGPMVMGTNWWSDMMDPDKDGYVHPDGRIVGGHAYRVRGFDQERRNPDGSRGAFRVPNSWGRGWAQKGQCWMSLKDLDALVKAEGEACLATETPLAA